MKKSNEVTDLEVNHPEPTFREVIESELAALVSKEFINPTLALGLVEQFGRIHDKFVSKALGNDKE